MDGAVVDISVIIPTYHRPNDLLRCLGSLERQTLGEFQTVVVDNSPDAELRERMRAFETRVLYVHEPSLGLHNARHAGARAATGDVLVFTDDDAEFSQSWLAAYSEAFALHPEMAAAG